MSGSTLDPDNLPADSGATVGKGHGTRALGPSDRSDTGSDVVGGPGLTNDEDRTYAEPGAGDDGTPVAKPQTAGPSLGDAELDSDTDSGGTGERSSAGMEPEDGLNQDIGFDRVVGPEEAGLGGGLDQAEEAQLGVTDEELDDEGQAGERSG